MENDGQQMKPDQGHGGNIHRYLRMSREDLPQPLDFSANINPLGPPEWLRSLVNRELEQIVHYPDPDCYRLRRAVAGRHGVDFNRVVAANGTTELLYLLPGLFPGRRLVLPVPSYIDYSAVFRASDHEMLLIELTAELNFVPKSGQLAEVLSDNDLVLIGSPNNPTGVVYSADAILALAERFPGTVFVIDEAFGEFVEGWRSVAGGAENIITLHSMTKFYAIPGLRLGYGIFSRSQAESLGRRMLPWTVNHLAQAVGARCLEDVDFQRAGRQAVTGLRQQLVEWLAEFSRLHVFPASANYLLIRLEGEMDAFRLSQRLLEQGILIRVCDNYQGLDHRYFRIAVRNEEENRRLLDALGAVFRGEVNRNRGKRDRKTPAIMFQGTSSNAGKSVLSAALCRILLQDGVRVAPFKAQNMSLNSFVTLDGLEMGRAQVVQAQAARLDPDVRMNPVLLKPNSDTGSQVIVHGCPVGNMTVRDYHGYKRQAMEAARRSYDELAAEYDVIVLEGAGSPAEVNLKAHDFVNMAMARYAAAPVLLVGDIDRGGVYASFVGTMDVLSEVERQLVAGFVVNRFRGDASLLADAHTYVQDYTGREVLGVVPYLADLGLPEEDSVSFKAGLFSGERPEGDHVELALINLPHISNFTDVEPFLEEPDVHLRVVSRLSELGCPDGVILPGSKNVIGDIRQLRESGLADGVVALATEGCEIVGICGGYQILGRVVHDPHGIESSPGTTVVGLGLLEMETTMESDKTLERKKGIHLLSGQAVYGYEIHHGLSSSSLAPIIEFEDHSACGVASADGLIWGAYLHGLFDADSFRRWFIDRLRLRKGLEAVGRPLFVYDLEPAFERLAAVVRQSLEMDRLYQLLHL